MAGFNRHHKRHPAIELGDEDPLYTRNVASGAPDLRRVSLRWLAGSVLTGVFSAALVWGALHAAVGFDEHLIVRPALARTAASGEVSASARKGDRMRRVPETKLMQRPVNISTVTRDDDRVIVRVRPYLHVETNLAAPVAKEIAARIPGFNPLDIFASEDDPPVEMAASDSIYGAEVDGEVAIKVADFPLAGAPYDETVALAIAEVEQTVREAAPFLADGAVEVASLPYVDPARFELASADPSALAGLAMAIAIAPENVSLVEKTDAALDEWGVEERVLEVEQNASLRQMLIGEGASPAEAEKIIDAMLANHEFRFLAGQKLLVGVAADAAGGLSPVRVALFEGGDPLAAVALSDHGTYVKAEAPALDAELLAVEPAKPAEPAGALPSVHAGLWGTGLALNIPEELIETLVRVFSYDVDYQGRLQPSDALEVIYSADGEAETAEILYAALSLGGGSHRFYRFRSAEDGTVDYFDETGKSAQKFLLRKPVTKARFTSPFGMRRHPILKRYRLHSGTDWAAPTGTPVLAAGDGVLESVGTRAGLGRSIVMRHANGYETTYNHMSGYAKGLKAGDRVRQGQVIGYVGSTGLSTGPHLHFEVLVNGRFVDPMKIRLPRGRELQGAELAAFEQERARIDELLVDEEDERVVAQ